MTPIQTAPAVVQSVFNGFMDETRNELWDSEKELVAYYSQNKSTQSFLTERPAEM